MPNILEKQLLTSPFMELKPQQIANNAVLAEINRGIDELLGCSKPGCGYPDGRPCIGCGRVVQPGTDIHYLLEQLYLKRAGRVHWVEGDKFDVAWCTVCGKLKVNPLAGEDTCYECIHRR